MKVTNDLLSPRPLSKGPYKTGLPAGTLNALMPDVIHNQKNTRNKAERAPRRHEQAKEAVLNYIRLNRLVSGSRLPTEEVLCRHFGWGRNTIVRALNELAAEGTLNRIQGSGTYVALPVEAERTYRIAVSSRPWDEGDDFCGPLIAGLIEEASTNQVEIVSLCQPTPDLAELREMKVDGVITMWWFADDLRSLIELHEADIAVVGLAQRSRSHNLPLICTDNFAGMTEAVTHLLDHGHQRIAYTCMNLGNSDIIERLSAFYCTLARAGLSAEPGYLQMQVGNVDRNVPLFESWWCSMNPKPTAMVVDAPDALALFLALAHQGVRIPEDLSVVVMDDRSMWRHHWPPLTVMRQPSHELGRRGMVKLLAMLRGEDEGLPEILPVELIQRESVRAITSKDT